MSSTSDAHPLRNQIMTALNTRLARKLTTLVHLPQLEMTPSVWQTLESSAPAQQSVEPWRARREKLTSACLKVILELVSSPEVLDAFYAATPPASRTAAQLIRPWWEFILRHRVEAAMRGLYESPRPRYRKRKAETAPGTAKSKKVGPILSVALADVANTAGAQIDQATAGETKEPKKPKDTKSARRKHNKSTLPTTPTASIKGPE
ncbi:hypothetical protein DFH06DRAFT_1320180 [Mycena polygramma]|nr:hypothetical protein DFH06DRAFT_1320180 [Mycena polygramma]